MLCSIFFSLTIIAKVQQGFSVNVFRFIETCLSESIIKWNKYHASKPVSADDSKIDDGKKTNPRHHMTVQQLTSYFCFLKFYKKLSSEIMSCEISWIWQNAACVSAPRHILFHYENALDLDRISLYIIDNKLIANIS